MPAQGSRRKRKKAKLPQWQVTVAIVVAVMVLSAAIWFLVRGQDGDDTPFDARLLELAESPMSAFEAEASITSLSLIAPAAA